jgi:hypothetical protein
MKPIQKAMTHIFDRVAEKQFHDLKRNKAYYDALVLTTPSGKEKQFFQVGDICETNDKSTLIKGVRVKIEEVYEENGYWKYIVSHGKGNKFRCMQRQIDLVKA